MAFKLVSSGGITADQALVEVEGSGAIAIGDHVSFNVYGSQYTSQRYVSRKNAPTAHTLFAIAAEALTSGTGLIKVILINPAQLWEVDGTTTCAATHLFKPTTIELNTVVNALTEQSAAVGGSGVFMPIKIVGATSDKKLIGRFVPPNNLGGV